MVVHPHRVHHDETNSIILVVTNKYQDQPPTTIISHKSSICIFNIIRCLVSRLHYDKAFKIEFDNYHGDHCRIVRQQMCRATLTNLADQI